MNWSDIRKEQKQAILLIAMWVFGGLFALYQFVLMPFIKNRGQSTGELEELHAQIQKAESAMQDNGKLRTEYTLTSKELGRALDEYIVPMENPLSWVTEKVYMDTRNVGVDIQSIADNGAGGPGWDALCKSERCFKPYAVRIVTECSYEKLLELVGALENSNPYLCVSGIGVAANDSDYTKHNVYLIVEWPMWARKVEIGSALKKPAGKSKPGPGAKTDSQVSQHIGLSRTATPA